MVSCSSLDMIFRTVTKVETKIFYNIKNDQSTSILWWKLLVLQILKFIHWQGTKKLTDVSLKVIIDWLFFYKPSEMIYFWIQEDICNKFTFITILIWPPQIVIFQA